jgi:hypothetical protein
VRERRGALRRQRGRLGGGVARRRAELERPGLGEEERDVLVLARAVKELREVDGREDAREERLSGGGPAERDLARDGRAEFRVLEALQADGILRFREGSGGSRRVAEIDVLLLPLRKGWVSGWVGGVGVVVVGGGGGEWGR